MRVSFLRTLERWVARYEREENDAKCEDVSFRATIVLVSKNLWCHMIEGANRADHDALTGVASDRLSKAQIDDFDVEAFIKQDVRTFEVAMSEPLSVHVEHTLQHLREEVANNGGIEFALIRNKLKKLATHDKLLHDVRDLDTLVTLDQSGLLLDGQILDNILVIKLARCINFYDQPLKTSHFEGGIVVAEHLDSVELIVTTVFGTVHLGCHPSSHLLIQTEITNRFILTRHRYKISNFLL